MDEKDVFLNFQDPAMEDDEDFLSLTSGKEDSQFLSMSRFTVYHSAQDLDDDNVKTDRVDGLTNQGFVQKVNFTYLSHDNAVLCLWLGLKLT